MTTEPPRSVGNYSILETLGKGGYSWVKKGLDAKSQRHVALKFMARANDSWAHEQAEQVRTEIKSLTQIRHDNVMKLYAYNLNAKYPEKNGKTIPTILLVLEYCPGGELFDILYYTDALDAKTGRTYFQMLIKGLKACHDNGVCHRDIKPQNLLLDRDYKLKLTDFGLSKIHDKGIKSDQAVMQTTYVGTRGYQAPELLAGKKYGNSCDVFSAGVVLFILLTGYPPFDQGDRKDKWYRPLYKGKKEKFWQQHEGCGVDPVCRTLLEGMLAYKPQERLTIDQIMEHEWFKGEVFTAAELKKELKARHAECMAKRDRDAAKQKDLVVSVKKRDIPEQHLGLKMALPPTGVTPNVNWLPLYNNPFESIWRAKELLEEHVKATVTFDKDSPFELSAIVHDGGTINRPVVKDDEEKEEVAEPKETINKYQILVHVRKDDDSGANYIEFKRGSCEGAHSVFQFRKILSDLMVKIQADKVFRPSATDSTEPEAASKGFMASVVAACAPSTQTIDA